MRKRLILLHKSPDGEPFLVNPNRIEQVEIEDGITYVEQANGPVAVEETLLEISALANKRYRKRAKLDDLE